ncbi:low molecular weight protein-tyrosine-phosphatase [Tenacibaculum sp. C7A-26P2]|uniref:low molecular weight protein-tyrosine-phosphatase n=1 Tax=Tenacibaculum sp. C7A-26P2 TaxID=3447504 RepID=UPI003F8789B1
MKILMVCLGNICRSPLAEGILASKVVSKNIIIDSAGTSGYHAGEHPDKRSIKIAEKKGIDISKQRSRKFMIDDFEKFDLIYAMDESNFQDLITLARNENEIKKVKLILKEVSENKILNVPDPYYGSNQGFEKVFEMLNEACEVIASKYV